MDLEREAKDNLAGLVNLDEELSVVNEYLRLVRRNHDEFQKIRDLTKKRELLLRKARTEVKSEFGEDFSAMEIEKMVFEKFPIEASRNNQKSRPRLRLIGISTCLEKGVW